MPEEVPDETARLVKQQTVLDIDSNSWRSNPCIADAPEEHSLLTSGAYHAGVMIPITADRRICLARHQLFSIDKYRAAFSSPSLPTWLDAPTGPVLTDGVFLTARATIGTSCSTVLALFTRRKAARRGLSTSTPASRTNRWDSHLGSPPPPGPGASGARKESKRVAIAWSTASSFAESGSREKCSGCAPSWALPTRQQWARARGFLSCGTGPPRAGY